ncbi:MAG: dephospho-CoA kinase [Oscillospiraceae bacterium]|nr:dephospho-CoA kinase [Oscillospiraceae bacterium]
MVLGLTGQTGAGKSTVCRMLQNEQNICVVDADQIARQVVTTGTDCLMEIVLHFSIIVLNEDGTLNRKKLAEIVFNDRDQLKELNRITFPHIVAGIKAEIKAGLQNGNSIVILDAPLLFESKADQLCDSILAVLADTDTRKQRIMQRDGLTEQEAEARIGSQHDDAFYLSRADHIIRNDGDATSLRLQVMELLEKLRTEH